MMKQLMEYLIHQTAKIANQDMHNAWLSLPKPFFILAPMEAVTDVIFRQVIDYASAPDLYMTEFTNATGWLHAGQKAIGGRLLKEQHENSRLIAQLWGADPIAMKELSMHCKEENFAGIDINMGCPDKSAVNTGGGAGLCKNPTLAAALIEAAKSANLPVSVKTRLGYSRLDEWEEWLGHLLQQNIINLTVHLRTKREMSKVPAHYELIDQIISLRDRIAPQTLITINGDIRSRQHGEELVNKHPGVNGVMIGRGVFHDPFCFSNAESSTPDTDKLLELLRLHLNLYDKYQSQTKRPFETLKRFFKIYIRDFEHAADLRHQLMQTNTTSEVREILDAEVSKKSHLRQHYLTQ